MEKHERPSGEGVFDHDDSDDMNTTCGLWF